MDRWDDIRFFIEVVRSGNLTAAARQLGVDQSTVSRRIASLEKSLKAQLFERGARGLELTHAGRDLLDLGMQMEERAHSIQRRALGQDSQLAGHVRLTMVLTLASHFLIPHIARFHRAYPGITLDILADNRTLDLARLEAEMAVRLARPTKGADLITRKLGTMAFGVYGATDWDRLTRTDSLEALEEVPILAYDESTFDLPELLWLEEALRSPKVEFRSNSLLTLAAATREKLGVAVLPCFLGDGTAGLRRLPLPATIPEREIWLVRHPDFRAVARIQAVSEFLIRTFHNEQDSLLGRGPGRTGEMA